MDNYTQCAWPEGMQVSQGRALFSSKGWGEAKTAGKKLGLGDPWGNIISECFLLSRVIFYVRNTFRSIFIFSLNEKYCSRDVCVPGAYLPQHHCRVPALHGIWPFTDHSLWIVSKKELTWFVIYLTGRWKLYEPADTDHGPVTLQVVTGNLVTATVLSQTEDGDHRWRSFRYSF